MLDNGTFEEIPTGLQWHTYGFQLFRDINNDGLMDVVDVWAYIETYINNGDCTFTLIDTWKPQYSILAVDDFDKDGKLDAITYSYDDTGNQRNIKYFVEWSDGEITEIPMENAFYEMGGVLSKYYPTVFDYDNNGYVDMGYTDNVH